MNGAYLTHKVSLLQSSIQIESHFKMRFLYTHKKKRFSKDEKIEKRRNLPEST